MRTDSKIVWSQADGKSRLYFEGSELRTLELAVSRRSLSTILQSNASHYRLR